MLALKIDVKDRGATARGMKRAVKAASKPAWFDTGVSFHEQMSDDRFTHRHATLAGYQQRTKAYTSRKLKKFGYTNPLEYSGRSRRAARNARITSTSSGANVRYSIPAFNFKNPKARIKIDMVAEFSKVLPTEADRLADTFDRSLDYRLNAENEINS